MNQHSPTSSSTWKKHVTRLLGWIRFRFQAGFGIRDVQEQLKNGPHKKTDLFFGSRSMGARLSSFQSGTAKNIRTRDINQNSVELTGSERVFTPAAEDSSLVDVWRKQILPQYQEPRTKIPTASIKPAVKRTEAERA